MLKEGERWNEERKERGVTVKEKPETCDRRRGWDLTNSFAVPLPKKRPEHPTERLKSDGSNTKEIAGEPGAVEDWFFKKRQVDQPWRRGRRGRELRARTSTNGRARTR